MSEFNAIWDRLDWSVLTNILFSIVPALICITFHEVSHGLVAYKLGDNTAKNQGRLTLNPIKHLDVMGLLSMIILKFGWAKPVPVDMRNFKNPKAGMAIVALAGPVSNIILAAIAMILAGVVAVLTSANGIWYEIWKLLLTMAYLSIAFAIFNIIPVPPLDGSKVLFSFLSERTYYKLMRYERYGMVILVALVWTGVLGTPLSNATKFVCSIMYKWIFTLFQAF